MIVGSKNPKAVIVLSSMEEEDAAGLFLEGRRGQVVIQGLTGKESVLGGAVQALEENGWAVTWMIQKVLKTGDMHRKPDDSEFDSAFPELLERLTAGGCQAVIPLGSALTRKFLKDNEASVSAQAGLISVKTLNEHKFMVLPNLEPGQILRKPLLMRDFQANFRKMGAPVSQEIPWVMLNFHDAVRELKRILKLFARGEIDHILFDTESTSLEPHLGKLLMYSWAHDADERAFCIPLTTNNEIPDREVFKEYQMLEVENSHKESITSEMWAVRENVLPKVNIVLSPEEVEQINHLVRKVLATVPIVGHNLKHDVKYTHYHGVSDIRTIKIKDDTNLMAFQLYGKGFTGWLSLKGLCERLLGAPKWDKPLDDFRNRFREVEKRDNFGNLPTGLLGPYACFDAWWNRYLYKFLRRELPDSMLAVTRVVTDVIRPFSEAEVSGVAVDQEVKKVLEEAYTKLQDSCEAALNELPKVKAYRQADYDSIYAKAAAKLKVKKPDPKRIWGMVFKLGNSEKVADLMYGEKYYNLPVQKEYMTKGGASGNARPETGKDVREHFLVNFLTEDTIESLRGEIDDHEIDNLKEARTFIELLTQYSRMKKLLSTYLGDAVEDQCEGIFLKPAFNLLGTISGRISSGFHVVDSWSDIKRLYTSRWKGVGGVIVAPDFSQLELRIAASVSEDPDLIQAYIDDVDIHTLTASKMFQIPIKNVSKDQRASGKCVHGDTLIATDRGMIPIRDIVGETPDNETVPYSGNLQLATCDGYRPIREVYRKEACHLTKVKAGSQVLIVTDDHPFVTGMSAEGEPTLKKASELTVDDHLFVLEDGYDE